MFKFITVFILATMCLMPSYSQNPKPKPPVYVIKKAAGEKLMTAEFAIKSACAFARISDFTIDKEITDAPGKVVSQLSSLDPEVLLLKVCSTFDVEFTKSTYEDGSSLFNFKKMKKK